MLWLGCGVFLDINGLRLGLWCLILKKKSVLMLLLGCVIKSNCGCGCDHSSQVDCVVVVRPGLESRVCQLF